MSGPTAIVSELYCRSEEKGKIVFVFMNEDFSSEEKLTLLSQFEKPEEPPSVWVYVGSNVNKTSHGEKFGEVSASSRIFINSNLSLD
jgi:hypothetical protein